MKLTKKQVTEAVKHSARKYGFSASTIRATTSLRQRAIQEWMKKEAEMEELAKASVEMMEAQIEGNYFRKHR